MIAFGAFREFRAWPDELVQRLRLVGEIFANALARKRADQDLHTRKESLRTQADRVHRLDPAVEAVLAGGWFVSSAVSP